MMRTCSISKGFSFEPHFDCFDDQTTQRKSAPILNIPSLFGHSQHLISLTEARGLLCALLCIALFSSVFCEEGEEVQHSTAKLVSHCVQSEKTSNEYEII